MQGSKRAGASELRIPIASSAIPIPSSPPVRGSQSYLNTQPLYSSPPPISHISQSAPGVGLAAPESFSRHGATPSTPTSAQRSRRRRRSGQEWSLFSELMENEGQIIGTPRHEQGPSSPRLNRRNSRQEQGSSSPTLNRRSSRAPGTPHNLTGNVPRTVSSPAQFREEEYFLAEESEQEDSDLDSDSEHAASDSTSGSSFVAEEPRTGLRDRLENIPTLYKNIFKCALAYLIGSLFTFSPFFSRLIADLTPGDDSSTLTSSGHMVATMSVCLLEPSWKHLHANTMYFQSSVLRSGSHHGRNVAGQSICFPWFLLRFVHLPLLHVVLLVARGEAWMGMGR